MKVLIRELDIINFRQIEDKQFRFSEGLNQIIGRNGSGKSNTLHAISWVFFGTDYTGRSQFAVVPIDADGDETNKEPSVTIKIQVDNVVHSLKRKLKDGKKTEVSIDGIPCKTLKEYDDFISKLFESVDRFRMYSNPFYFSETLHWKEQRELFMRFFALPSNGDIIAEIAKRTAFRTDMSDFGKKDLDREADRCRYEKKEIDKERSAIRAKIELLDEQLEGRKSIDIADLKSERDDLRKELTSYQSQVAEYQKEMKILSQKERDLRYELLKLEDEQRYSMDIEQRNKESELNHLLSDIEQSERLRNHLVSQYKDLKGTFDASCPRCGQTLPEDKIEEAKSERDKALLEIVKKGKQTAETIKKLKEKQEKIKSKPAADIKDNTNEIERIRIELKSLPTLTEIIPFNAEKQEKLDELERIIANEDTYTRSLKQRKELKSRESDLSRQYEELEMRSLDLEDMYQERSKLLARRVNKSLKNISVKVVDVQKNGSVKETFEIVKNGIPYRELNTAGQLEASIELTQFLKKNLNVSCPLIIDNGERYTDVELNYIEDQIIIAIAKKGERLRG